MQKNPSMSLRAINKKREIPSTNTSSINSTTTITSPGISTRASLFRKLTNRVKVPPNSNPLSNAAQRINKNALSVQTTKLNLREQYKLIGRLTQSNPELGIRSELLKNLDLARLVRTKSEGDVNKLLGDNCGSISQQGALLNAKSEVCLKTISTHNYHTATQSNPSTPRKLATKKHLRNSERLQTNAMISGARSHRDLSQSAYISAPHHAEVSSTANRRRMSEGSYMRQQRSNSMSTSEITTSSRGSSSFAAHSAPPIDPNSSLRIPIIGYEVMEERARFTVYKLRVENPNSSDCWLVMRRYTDFVRLNTKLKQLFPHYNLNLPRKKIFGDNFNAVFLDNRVQGLQIFVNSIMCREELRKCQLVREFFCLDEPPTYSESMEECRVS